MILSNVRQLFAFRAFLVRRLTRYFFAEIFFLAARIAPFPLNDIFFQWTLTWNPMHIPAALAHAQILRARNDSRARGAIHIAQQTIENHARVSASDLALMRVPERITRRITHQSDETLYAQWCALAEPRDGRIDKAASLAAESSVSPNRIADAWANIETKWAEKNFTVAFELAAPFIKRGDFVSPLHPLPWAERALMQGQFDSAETCLQWAQQWTPERALVWQWRAKLEMVRGNKERARMYLERAASLNPESLDIFFAQQNLERNTALSESSSTRLRVSAPAVLKLGEITQVECELENARGEWEIHVLPPAGWGIVALPRAQRLDSQHRASFELRACRPDRVRGDAWILTFVAVSDAEYVMAEIRAAIPDATCGKILLLVTEDHELWEERGRISRADVEKLLVEKSKFAAERFAPWTHMVEVGSSLALLDWAAAQKEAWSETRNRVREHLVSQVKEGNDIQPHLHAFHLPVSNDFPYTLTDAGIVADKKFLLTLEEHRRDFARAYAPQERIAAVADAVAEIERVAYAANANYRAVLWRSGQLEFGETDAERAWSSVALLRAGLFADSDVPRKTFAPPIALTAFFAALENPFAPNPDGEILQLPIAANLEGDFLSEARKLQNLAKRTGDALRDKSGIHLITLLTHDKFINARRGADEFCLDENYNEWQTLRAHLDAWRDAGAERVTAQQAIETMLDDGAWRVRAWLCEQERLASCVRYTIRLLGNEIPISEEYPQWVLVTIPPFLRADVLNVRVTQGENELPIFENSANDFWIRVDDSGIHIRCEFGMDFGGRA